jgi:hypothetical protein
MKKLLIFASIILLVSCKKEDKTTVDDAVNEVKESTTIAAKEGTGKVTLSCNGKDIITDGVCGALVTMGSFMVAVKDKTNPAKVLTITFNDENMPEDGKIYKIKSKDYAQEVKAPSDEVTVGFTEVVSNSKMNNWGSDNAKGTLQFNYYGNEIKCIIKDVTLTPSEMYNADDLKANANVTGELTFYKN